MSGVPSFSCAMKTLEERVQKAVREDVAIVAYDSRWPKLFRQEAGHLRACLPPRLVRRIEHFGSTSVPGLAAKPVVDMLVEVSSLRAARAEIAPILESQGYDYFWRPTFGDDVPPWYAFFIKRAENGIRTHHIHMVTRRRTFQEHWDRLLFRDYLIAHPQIARDYEQLKNELAAAHPNDRVAYTSGKTAFISRVMAMVRESPERCARRSSRCAIALGVFMLFALTATAADSRLADAAEKSERATIRTLLTQHADVDAPQADGMTALHWAAYLDDLEIAKVLVEANANVKATNRYGVTPLSLACQNGNASIVELLLERGADPNTTLRGGETVLMTAARTGKLGPVNALLKRGADVNAKKRRGQTALMWAAADGHTEVVELLFKAGADIHATLPDSGFTPFFFAAREGRADVVRALLKAGADVNEAMQPRRAGGKNPNKGTSALILAVENGHFELALSLIEAGADPNDQRSGFTPLHVMTWVRKPPRGEDEGTPPPPELGKLSSPQFIRELVKRGADVNARLTNGKGGLGKFNTKGATPFLMASATADVAYMRLLLELGADPSISNVDNCTLLMVACGIGVGSAAANEVAGEESEVLEAAQLLLKLGADINAVDANGETAMHGAALKNLPKVVQFLADNGAKVEVWNRKNSFGSTPLMFAQGYRPGNFKPSFETVDAIQRVMLAAGVAIPTNTAPVVLRNSDWEPVVPVKKKP